MAFCFGHDVNGSDQPDHAHDDTDDGKCAHRESFYLFKDNENVSSRREIVLKRKTFSGLNTSLFKTERVDWNLPGRMKLAS